MGLSDKDSDDGLNNKGSDQNNMAVDVDEGLDNKGFDKSRELHRRDTITFIRRSWGGSRAPPRASRRWEQADSPHGKPFAPLHRSRCHRGPARCSSAEVGVFI